MEKRKRSKERIDSLSTDVESVEKQHVEDCDMENESKVSLKPSEDKDGNIHRLYLSKVRKRSTNLKKMVVNDEHSPHVRKSERLQSRSDEWSIQKTRKKHIFKSAVSLPRNNQVRNNKILPRSASQKIFKKTDCKIRLLNPARNILDDHLWTKEFNEDCREESQENVLDEDDIEEINNCHYQDKSKKKIIHKKRPCEVCGRYYNTFYLKVHMRKHTGEKPFCCSECDKHFSTDSLLRTHFQRYHGNTDELQCGVCHKVFASKGSLKIHKQIHSEEKPYKCHLCDKEFKQPGVLNEHLKTHSNDFPFQCEVCGKRFKSKRSVFRHKESAHDGIQRTYLCTVCGKVFHDKSSLWRHQKRHEQGYTKHICEVCGKQFHERKVLSTHMLIHEDKKPYQCDVCHKQFRHYSVLKRHQSVHTGIKPFKCDLCGRQFIHRVYMLRHKCLQRNKSVNASEVNGFVPKEISVTGASLPSIQTITSSDTEPLYSNPEPCDDENSMKLPEDSKASVASNAICLPTLTPQPEILSLPPLQQAHENSAKLVHCEIRDYEQEKLPGKISNQDLQLHHLLQFSNSSQQNTPCNIQLQQEDPVHKDLSIVPKYCLQFSSCQRVCSVFPSVNVN